MRPVESVRVVTSPEGFRQTVVQYADGPVGDYVKAVVDRAPELTDEQTDKIRGLLAPGTRPRAPRKKPDVYFIRVDSPGGEIKIGYASSVKARLTSLQTGSPYRMEIVGVVAEGGEELERELHAQFAHLRMSGEWFRPGAELWAYIESLEDRP